MGLRTAEADNITMKGGGYYSAATKGAKDVIDGATPLVLGALDALLRERNFAAHSTPFVMTDMGCADGGTSLGMVEKVLARVRAEAPKRPISMVYSDQPRNDYNALFNTLHDPAGGYLDRIENLSLFASATSFYRQIVPAGTLDLGFSATAMHWLSAKPRDLAGHVHATGAEGGELESFRQQGRRDWETILLARAAELKSGGHLVLVNFGIDEKGRYLGNTGGRHMFNILNDNWRALRAEGRIGEAEYRAMTLPQYYNGVEEFTRPLTDASAPPHRAGLRLVSAETRVVLCPFAQEFARHGSAADFAEAYIPTIRSWNESIFFAGLDAGRPRAERQAIIDDYYGRYRAQVEASPEGHAMDYVHCYLVIRKD